LFPFGFGLSYTTFAYSDLKVEPADALQVSFTVRNTGQRTGEEIAEVYGALPSDAQEPPRRLIGWKKIVLEPGESKTVTMHVEPLYLSIYDTSKKDWRLVPGQYTISAGRSSRDLPLTGSVTLAEQQ